MVTTERQNLITHEFVIGLRELATILVGNPDLAVRGTRYYSHTVWCDTAEEMARFAKSIGGKWDKYSDEYFLGLEQYLTDKVKIDLCISHSNAGCEKVVVGKRKVMKADPAVDIPQVEVEEDVTVWKCPPSILAAANVSKG